MTLVEVLVGLAIMGSLVVALLVATSRLKAQDACAEYRLEACRVADGLLSGWWARKEEFPRTGSGIVEGGSWSWRTRLVPNRAAKEIGAQVVALEVFPGRSDGGDPVVRVEVVLPDEEESDVPQDRPDPD